MEPREVPGHTVAEAIGAGRRYVTPGGAVDALAAVTVAIPARSLTVIAGPSGSGKSTLLALLGCLDRPTDGRVTVGGTDVGTLSRRARRRMRRTTIATLLPQPSDNLLDRLDARGNVVEAARRRCAGTVDADALLALLGLEGSGSKAVRQLSGGEQQRVALAGALAGDPVLLLADEPTASLDRESARLVITALRTAVDHGATVVVATHDPDVIAAADTVVRLDHGRLVERGEP